MSSQPCSCPFCPLVAAQVQVCKVKVVFPAERTASFCPMKLVEDESLCDMVRHHLAIVALVAKNNQALSIGKSWNHETDEFHLSVYRRNHRTFLVCFHAKVEDMNSCCDAM